MSKTQGLREQIANSSDEASVTELLKVGATYTMASNRTKRSWKATAHRRFSSFAAPTAAEQKLTAPRQKKRKVAAKPTE